MAKKMTAMEKNIQIARVRAGMRTNAELAERIGIRPQLLSYRIKTSMPVRCLREIIKVTGMTDQEALECLKAAAIS